MIIFSKSSTNKKRQYFFHYVTELTTDNSKTIEKVEMIPWWGPCYTPQASLRLWSYNQKLMTVQKAIKTEGETAQIKEGRTIFGDALSQEDVKNNGYTITNLPSQKNRPDSDIKGYARLNNMDGNFPENKRLVIPFYEDDIIIPSCKYMNRNMNINPPRPNRG